MKTSPVMTAADLFAFAAVPLAAATYTGTAFAHDASDAGEVCKTSRGAQLCGNWWAVLKMPKPEDTHPACPDDGKYWDMSARTYSSKLRRHL